MTLTTYAAIALIMAPIIAAIFIPLLVTHLRSRPNTQDEQDIQTGS